MTITEKEADYAKRHRIRSMSDLMAAIINGDIDGEKNEQVKSEEAEVLLSDTAIAV